MLILSVLVIAECYISNRGGQGRLAGNFASSAVQNNVRGQVLNIGEVQRRRSGESFGDVRDRAFRSSPFRQEFRPGFLGVQSGRLSTIRG